MLGNADDDANSEIDFGELYDYVSDNVTYTAESRFPRPQHPVRVIRSAVVGDPTVVKLQPSTLREVLADNAELLANFVEDRSHDKLGVLEFINVAPGVGELLGANYGSLGKWCTEEFERRLGKAGRGRFRLIDKRRLQAALTAEGFSINDLGTGYEQLSERVGGMPVIAVGSLCGRQGRLVTIKCSLVTVDGESLGETIGIAQLNEDEWAMLGRSVKLEPRDRVPVIPVSAEAPPADPVDRVIENIDERSQGAHPLQDPEFDFPVKIMVDGKERPLVFKSVGEGEDAHTECFVGLRKDEVYEVWVGNQTGAPVKMRLLVDGCNTMPEEEDVKGITTKIIGKRVNLDEASGWVLDPAKTTPRRDGSYIWAIRGFFEEVGELGSLRKFTVDDADMSLAARQNFTDQIGLITAAFYVALPPGDRSRGNLGTRAGERQAEKTKSSDMEFGNMLSVVHIRYVDADTLSE